MTPTLGTIGVWGHESLFPDDLARDVESLGYGAIWLGGSPDADLAPVDRLLEATEHLVVATGIVNIWSADAHEVAASYHRIAQGWPGRFVLGIGVGHPEATSDYKRPYAALVDYLDVLDAENVPSTDVVLAALGPKVLKLAADRSAGAHPYLTPPQHTRESRELVGDGVLLAPEQKVVVDTDVERGRALGRAKVANPYLKLTNYTSNLRRLGWSDADLENDGSDALIDSLVGLGDAAAAAVPVQGHLDAGADHVAIQLLTRQGEDPLPGYRGLAAALGVSG